MSLMCLVGREFYQESRLALLTPSNAFRMVMNWRSVHRLLLIRNKRDEVIKIYRQIRK